MRTTTRGGGKPHADKGKGSENRYFLRTTEGVILLSCSDGKRNDEHTLSGSVDRRVQRERRPVALRVVQQIKKRGRTKEMTQSEIFVEGELLEHMQHIHGQIWELLLVKVLNLFYTASQCAFISGLLGKLAVSVVKINCLSSFLCPPKLLM